mmetsp:Transcript_122393/g.280448  ORF Transcript_122393/g.280448 Transcript_122393/m.280448 type:complete len:83 (+) Transcript_122393:47-295(+)
MGPRSRRPLPDNLQANAPHNWGITRRDLRLTQVGNDPTAQHLGCKPPPPATPPPRLSDGTAGGSGCSSAADNNPACLIACTT